jgi:hypothetical protein
MQEVPVIELQEMIVTAPVLPDSLEDGFDHQAPQ